MSKKSIEEQFSLDIDTCLNDVETINQSNSESYNELLELGKHLADKDFSKGSNKKAVFHKALKNINENKGENKMKKLNIKRRHATLVASLAAVMCLLTISTVYAEDISQAIKSFFNKTPIYSTIVDGDAYYLKESCTLDKNIKIESVMVSEGELNMEITTDLSKNELGDINIIPQNDPNTVYYPGGYSEEKNQYYFSFMNKTEENYNIKPFKDFRFIIAGNSYDVSLQGAESLNLNDEIYTCDAAANNVKGVNMGAKMIDRNGKLNIQLITSFEDKDLKLDKLGKPTKTKVVSVTENRGKEGFFGSSTADRVDKLYVYDEMNHKYQLDIPQNAKGRPITIFETNAPQDKNLTLRVPAIIASYEKTIDSFSLNIPNEGEVTLNKEIDFNIQKAVLKKITRVSSTSAQVEFELNTDGNEDINIRSFGVNSLDMKKVSAEFNGNKAIMNLEFDKNLDTANIEISYPSFVMNGNWVIDMK